MWQYNQTETLYHHGVKGQKWGVRKYINSNGTFTSAGKKRYGGKKTRQYAKMSIKDTEAYAKAKIKSRGARQAIDDETSSIRSGIIKKSLASGIAGTSVALLMSGGNPVVAAGVAYVSTVAGTAISTIVDSVARAPQAQRNIDAIKRISDIPDETIGTRYNTR